MLAGLLNACGDGSSDNALDTQANLQQQGRVLYASATAAPEGDGSRTAPFDSLQALEAASAPGDTLIILPSPVEVPALDGGIQLKSGQRLLGDGPSVLLQTPNAAVSGAAELMQQPRIRNTDMARLNGDVVRLAPNSQVSNLVVTESVRGGIYGLNVPGVKVTGNDVSGFNTSCTIGFTVEPFPAPSSFPQGAAPLVLPAGWAGIMVDADNGEGEIDISSNYVHDSACGNGIDVRISGSADYLAQVSQNFVTQLEHGPLHELDEIHLVHAITLQVTDDARLEAESNSNTQTFIGSP
ncbi:MAG: hypothetical protein R3352_11515, partial [Salinisphaeraceae bacterium]|nr:hypothetical protein [Salinisphaeraceae bacterium]